jgi:hypothetical protein
MRGYFGIDAEGISKPMNLGNLIRSAHAFGASFVFLIDADYTARSALSDTSQAERQMPLYRFDAVEEMVLPKGSVLIGDELTKRPSGRAAELPAPAQRRLRVRPGAQRAVAGHGRALRSRRAHPDPVLHQPGRRRRGRHVRSHAEPPSLRAAAGALRRRYRALAPARLRHADHSPAQGRKRVIR